MPPTASRLLADSVPGCEATFYPDDGHFSVLLNHAEDIFRTLTAG